MNRYNELISILIKATLTKKLKWSQSSVQGGYITKINDNGIEILPPITSLQKQMLGISIATAIGGIEGEEKKEELLAQNQWRVIIYDGSGNKEFIIPESKLDMAYFKKELDEKIESPISFLHLSIKRVEEDARSEKLTGLIEAINKI